jgi:hypothetical protein
MEHAFNVQGSAALGVLAFLGTGALLAACAVSWMILRARQNRNAARWIARSAAMVAGGYAAALVGFSAASRPRELRLGDEKYFCEIDCHLAYSVVSTETLPAVPDASADGRSAPVAREVVRLRVWFDPSTISPHRGNALLHPNPRAVSVVGSDGRTYAPSDAGLLAIESIHGPVPPLTQPLRPGESYTTALVFDLPRGVSARRLVLTESDPVTRLLIGHENSPFHGKASFVLPAPLAEARS